ncbi:kinase-like domain-containing protein [Dioszegia hungarica]|uniref:mitogen-activated protein kinase kinase n=1 Tax=Dioszegia hungarica TaxID=4972 RepID=A0AA38H5W9_9TREE|nr:kinase-like domain-containing protein [Dioszegia hungarica]KAI9633024.1 kinase-like domain-containing protein [Dioszegia hungarica]
MTTPPPLRRPGGARPNPSTSRIIPPQIHIPEGNVPGSNVDQNGENGWQHPPDGLPPISGLPSLAYKPMARSSPGPSTRPKLSLSGFSTPSAGLSPLLIPATAPAPPPLPAPLALNRPGLLNAPSASLTSRNRASPSLRLAIPSLAPGPSPGAPAGSAYPSGSGSAGADGDEYGLNTPTATSAYSGFGSEDRNPTLVPRNKDYDGDEESSYGCGRLNNGLGTQGGGDAMSSMTADIRQALSRSRFDSFNSATSSRAGILNGDRRGSIDVDSIGRGSGRSTPVRRSMEDDRPELSPVFDPSKLVVVRRLGEGSGGAVELVRDPGTGRLLAKKVIARTANPAMHRQLLRELEFLDACSSPYIVDHYGSFLADHDSQVGILMEYCEGGSLDSLLRRMKETGMRCSEHVLGRIASSVLRGLDYLHERRIIHRDIKPSNILVTKSGQCKLCDFGVSGELIDSVAGTFTGTSYYMAPERIQGKPYSIRADVWSLGLTLHEIAHLRFPFPPEGESEYVAPIELLSYIVTALVPVMIDDESIGRVWSEGIKSFMGLCLIRSGTERPSPRELLSHPFILTSEAKKVNMAKWVAALLDA